MKPIEWIGSSKNDLLDLPGEVRVEVGHALYLAQIGRKHENAKPMQGHGGASVLEICEDFNTDTYRVVYTVRYEEAVYVLHSVKKKSTQGIKTPQRELDIIEQRLKIAEGLHKAWQQQREAEEKSKKSSSPSTPTSKRKKK